jgi:hypothetical protein
MAGGLDEFRSTGVWPIDRDYDYEAPEIGEGTASATRSDNAGG